MTGPPVPRESGDGVLRTLMAAYQRGDLDAFDGLYGALEGELRGFFAARCHDRHRVDDLVQDTFLQVHRSRRSYRDELPVRPWLYAIATRVLLMHVRRVARRERPEVALPEIEPAAHADDQAAILTRIVVGRALARVPPDGRRAFLLHHWHGLSFRDIAARLGIEPAAAKVRSSRAAQRLRRLLGPSENADG